MKLEDCKCPCLKNGKSIKWKAPSPQFILHFFIPKGKEWAQRHEERHAATNVIIYRNAKGIMEKYLNICWEEGDQKLIFAKAILSKWQDLVYKQQDLMAHRQHMLPDSVFGYDAAAQKIKNTVAEEGRLTKEVTDLLGEIKMQESLYNQGSNRCKKTDKD